MKQIFLTSVYEFSGIVLIGALFIAYWVVLP